MTAESRCGVLRYKHIYSLCNKYITWYKILFQALQQKSVAHHQWLQLNISCKRRKICFQHLIQIWGKIKHRTVNIYYHLVQTDLMWIWGVWNWREGSVKIIYYCSLQCFLKIESVFSVILLWEWRLIQRGRLPAFDCSAVYQLVWVQQRSLPFRIQSSRKSRPKYPTTGIRLRFKCCLPHILVF